MAQRRKNKTTLAPEEVEHFKQLLLKKRAQIVGDVNEIEDEALKKSRGDASGDLSSMPIHMADIGSDNYAQEFALGLMDSERKMIGYIDEALGRVADGSYGVCVATGKAITKPRLEAKPWARYCVEHARKLENGLVTQDEESD